LFVIFSSFLRLKNQFYKNKEKAKLNLGKLLKSRKTKENQGKPRKTKETV